MEYRRTHKLQFTKNRFLSECSCMDHIKVYDVMLQKGEKQE